MAIHSWWNTNRSVRSLQLLICDELRHILLRSCSNASLVFASFVILFHDFRPWMFTLQLWILSLFMSSNTCFSHRLFGLPLVLLKFGFHSVTFFNTFSSHPYMAVPTQPLCLCSFHNVFSLQPFLDL